MLALVCQCNRTLNLLSRPEYFRLDSNVDNGQLRLANLFTAPNTLTLTRSQSTVPSLTLTMIKGPIDLMSIQIGNRSGEFNAYITVETPSGRNTIGPIKSKQGVIGQCSLKVSNIKLEFSDLPILTTEQSVQINLTTCEHTLRKSANMSDSQSDYFL